MVGVIYEAWEGNGRCGTYEPLLQSGISVTLGSAIVTLNEQSVGANEPGSYGLTAVSYNKYNPTTTPASSNAARI